MDDPWGSPWATNDSNPIPEPPPRATTLELPGRILARNRSSSSISPWAVEDDGAFNHWASGDSGLTLPPIAAGSSSPWMGWGGDSGLNTSQTQLSARTQDGSLGLPSPNPAWPPTSPGLFPSKTVSRRSSSRSLSRQPTPDPWATETSEHRLSLPPAVHIAAEQAAFSTLDRHDEVEEHGLGIIQDELSAAAELQYTRAEAFEPGYERLAENGPEVRIDTDPSQEPDSGQNEEGNSGSSGSRHSSMSNGSQHDERPDSPITSMDEDAKDRPQILRRASTKVQDMVQLFDGLTKRKDSSTLLVPDPNGSRRPSASRSVRSFRTDDASDFGDFEDAEGFDSPVQSRQASVSDSRPTSRAGHVRSGSKTFFRKASTIFAAVSAPPPISEEPSKFDDIHARFGPVHFAPDMDFVGKMFDMAKLDAEQPPVKDYSLDTVEGIIKDSFTAVSERKAWYRISRAGTMRKHNLGIDDDNYRRVTWAGSQVKEDATKIVARWMGENAYYAGRPKAGGGPMVRGGGFDWDSNNAKAETLSFDEIFGKRKSVRTPTLSQAQAPRPFPLQPQAHARGYSDGEKSLPPNSPMSIPAPPAAFGWSTGGSGTSTPASVRPPSLMRQSIDVSSMKTGTSRPSSKRESEGRPSLQLAPPLTKPVPELPKPTDPTPTMQDSEDDDDEWGEMVASPTTDTIGGFFGGSLNGSMASLSVTSLAMPAATPDTTTTTLHSVSSALRSPPRPTQLPNQSPSTAAPVDVWDFSSFDSTVAAPAIPPTTTSKSEFDFDSPLQSPTQSVPSRTASPMSVLTPSRPHTPTQNIPSIPSVPSRTASPMSVLSPSRPHTPIQTIPSRSASPVLQPSRAPTPPNVPFRPQHTSKSSSLSLVRPSPLHNVLTPEVAPPDLPAKTVKFAEVKFAEDEPVDEAAVRRVVDRLPDLSYMLR